MRRAGIFAFFDDEGHVHEYVEYLLDDLIQNLDMLIIICNGCLSDEGRQVLSKYTQELYVRPDTGFDIAGYKSGILRLGLKELEKYDELVLLNDSFFGPLYPFKEVFDEMASRPEVDFWGLSAHGAVPNIPNVSSPYDHRYRYLQTYFVAFRKRLMASQEFQSFWDTLPEYKNFSEAAANFGPAFTKRFEDAGFRVGVYSDTADLESQDITKNISNHTFNIYEMVANRRFPVLKRKAFITRKSETLRYNYGNDLKKAMEYVERETDYDTSLIYKYLLSKYDLNDIHQSLNLTAIVPDVDVYGGKRLYQGKKIALVLHTSYPDLFDYDLRFLRNLPPEVDIILTNRDDGQLKMLREKFGKALKNHLIFVKVEQRGRDISALLVGCHDYLMQYEYICFVHDKKSTQKENTAIGPSFRDLLWENTLFSPGYVSNILNRFEEHPCLGLQVPPIVYHGSYFVGWLNTWTICYEKAAEVAYTLGMTVPMDKSKGAFSTGTFFWARTDALKTIFMHDWTYQVFPREPAAGDGTLGHVLERLLPYVAQYNGYYSEYVLNPQYAASELTNFRTMHWDTLDALRGAPRVQFDTHAALIRSLRGAVDQFRRARLGPVNSPCMSYQRYQVRHSLLLYADKKLPKELSHGVRRVLKVPADAQVSNDVGVKGALVLWANERAPRPIGRFVRKIVKM